MANAFVCGLARRVTIRAMTRQTPAAATQAGSAHVTAICQSMAAVGTPRTSKTSASACWASSDGDRTGRRAAASCTPIQRTAPANLSRQPFASLRHRRSSNGRESMTRRLEPEDLYAIKVVDDPQITPDGQRVAYVVVEIDRKTYDYHRTIWVSDTAQRVPAVRRIDRLCNRLDGVGWTYERRSHLFRIRSEGGEPEQLTDGDWDDGSPAFSPDGRRIAFTSDRTVERWSWPANDIWVLDLPSKRLTRLTDETVSAGPPAWSPDGRQLAFVAARRRHEDGYTDLLVADAATAGAVRKLTEDFPPTFSDTAIDDQRAGHGGPHLYWSTDGKEIYSQAAGRGSTLVYAVPATGGTPRLVIGGQRRIYALSMDRDRRRIVLASSDPSTPGDLFLQDSAGGRETRFTELNASLFREVRLATPQEFTFKGADGWDIQGWIIRPSPHPHAVEGKSERPPAVLEIHGGPMAMYSWSFFFEFQLLASHGYAVVFTNPRGSTGYGRAFSAAVNGYG